MLKVKNANQKQNSVTKTFPRLFLEDMYFIVKPFYLELLMTGIFICGS